ncbi:MAG: ATP-binding protein [Xanthobacteraceae bacterium]|nr:ATP-binding protein [Xanthobacteraceae bacterium]
MPLLRLPGKLLRGEEVSRADVFDAPAERIIAQGRLVLATLSVIAVQLNPALVTIDNGTAIAVLVAYGIFAIGLTVGRVWRFREPAAGYLVHACDVAFLLVLGALSGGRATPVSAFFAFFVLVAASLRWNWQAVVATAGVLAIAIWGAAATQSSGIGAALIRGVYVLIMGVMLAYSGAIRERRREQLTRLTAWPGPDPAQMHSPNLADMLAHCAEAIEAPRVLVLWEESEEPFVNVGLWQNGEYKQAREMTGAYGQFVRAKSYVDAAFWTDDAGSSFAVTSQGPVHVEAPILEERLIKAFVIHNVGTAPFQGSACRGRVFVLDRASWSDFQLHLVEIIASRLANALDRQFMQTEARSAAAERERIRLTRDLHDGLLQSLTAAGLQIKLLSDSEEGERRTRLEVVGQLLNAEQRRIRDFVRKTPGRGQQSADVPLGLSLQEMMSETARHWNCATSLTVEPPDATAPAALCVHLSLMLAEAVANAVRHGRASSVRVTIRRGHKNVSVEVHDDGLGFDGATFSLNDEDLVAAGIGPFSLHERVRELGGLLGVRSSPGGVTLQIQLPLS